MARSEARILVDIWDDVDFLDLSRDAQRMFMFLLSQPDLAHDGVLPLRERRWTRTASDQSTSDVINALDELARDRFVVMDDETEELLVRSFIRRDKVYRQPNVLRSAKEHVPSIKSRKIRASLSAELWRIIETEPMVEQSATLIREMMDLLEKPPGNPSRNPSSDGCGDPSADPTPGAPGERGVVTTVSSDSPIPFPLSPAAAPPDSEAATAQAAAEPASRSANAKAGKLPSTHPKLAWTAKEIDADHKWQEFWAAYPSSRDKGHARTAWLKALREKAEPDQLIHGAQAYRNDPQRKPHYTKHAATWLNGECWLDYDEPVADEAPAGPRPFWEN